MSAYGLDIYTFGRKSGGPLNQIRRACVAGAHDKAPKSPGDPRRCRDSWSMKNGKLCCTVLYRPIINPGQRFKDPSTCGTILNDK